ncbi:acyl-CoA dehydrogenase family protein [Paenibacillaceae bacterium WGS1546]|uniref:acyl-CoA dehydrogenase family protein n=1 Tax=Cohnella sp. WGS1546 TaxID=3366810 RepID=UPI00372D2F01
MGTTEGVWGSGPSEEYEALAERFRPIFRRIREGAVRRELDRKLLHEEIGWLKQAGFGAVRVPRELGGSGATLPELFGLLTELAEADSNAAQALRIHFSFVERIRGLADGDVRSRWLRRVAQGDIVGNALTEIGEAKVGVFSTTLSADAEDGRLRLDGTKFYSTGAIYADWIVVGATAEDGSVVTAIVPSAAAGVDIADDWAGFGQTLTGSGTTTFARTPVDPNDVLARDTHAKYSAAFVQKAAEAVQRACDAQAAGDEEAAERASVEAEIETAQAQTVVARLALDAAASVFDALGASATIKTSGLDRHWRNARTIASHNPLMYKERVVGDYAVNGTRPPFSWQTGIATS